MAEDDRVSTGPSGGRRLSDEALKRNALLLADLHRPYCAGATCTVSLALLGELLLRAGIEVSEDEWRRLW